MTIVTLITADSYYSLYQTEFGELRIKDVTLTEGTLPKSMPVSALWQEFCVAVDNSLTRFSDDLRLTAVRKNLFLAYLRGPLRVIGEIGFCPACSGAYWEDELENSTADGYACDDCYALLYTDCGDCGNAMRTSTLMENGHYPLGSDSLVCGTCIENHYFYCEPCDGYYHVDDGIDHAHDEDDEDDEDCDDSDSGSCCASPALAFRVRNGTGMLGNDTQFEVEIPARISREGLDRIRRLLIHEYDTTMSLGYHRLAYYAMDDLSAEWVTRQGTYPKRLSKLAYDQYKLKLPPKLLADIGTIARDHSQSANLVIAFTRRLNMSARAFYHGDSCWWGGYSASRCALKTNGGFGMRSFDKDGMVSGRAWVLPLRLNASSYTSTLAPTFETEDPAAFVTFNGYGELSGYTSARIMAQLAGWSYTKVDFSCEPMYINSGGYLVAAEETVQDLASGLAFRLRTHARLYEDEVAERVQRLVMAQAQQAAAAEANQLVSGVA